MAFGYNEPNEEVVDRERHLRLKYLGGRPEQAHASFQFYAPECVIAIRLYYHFVGIKFEFPGVYDSRGRETFVISSSDKSHITLDWYYALIIEGSCDLRLCVADIKDALACHYSFGKQFDGPVYILESGPHGEGRELIGGVERDAT